MNTTGWLRGLEVTADGTGIVSHVRRGQRQSGGDEATNIQAGRDAVVYNGVTANEARSIALDVFYANFLKLRDVAEELVNARVDKFTADFFEQLLLRQANGLGNMHDPDMLQAVFNAQKGYALSGDEDLEQALIDLLVDRASQEGCDIKTLVLNEAIATIPKLTIDQRSAIAVCFLMRYTNYTGPLELTPYYDALRQNLVPFADKMPSKLSAYQHIQYAGAGSVGAFTVTLESALAHGAGGYFTRGFKTDQVPESIRAHLEDPMMFIPCLRDTESLQVKARSDHEVIELAKAKGVEERVLQQLAKIGGMTEPDIRTDVTATIPELGPLFDQWDNSGLARTELTTIGIAIGHGYWRRVTNNQAELGDRL